MEDYDTEIVEIWPDNEPALDLFRRVGTKWKLPAMGGMPVGLQWEAIYPLMDRLKLENDAWTELHDDLTVMEWAAVDVMHEFAPKSKQ